ncbi:MAG: DUF4174 domain-containing protein [Hyphomicrobiaceae bacterium]|nr:DUF4174 domain-containing protein [Hyphomicrobiaceae bacterium]
MRKSALLAAFAALAASHVPAEAISGYRWKKRPLIVFAGSENAEKLGKQRRIVEAHRADLAERDLVVVYVVGNDVSATLGAPPGLSAGALRRKYGIKDGEFRAVLVGKDGGVKKTAASPLTAEALAGTIDAMPMRRDEVRRRARKG